MKAQIAFGRLGKLDDNQSNDFTEIENLHAKGMVRKN